MVILLHRGTIVFLDTSNLPYFIYDGAKKVIFFVLVRQSTAIQKLILVGACLLGYSQNSCGVMHTAILVAHSNKMFTYTYM